MSHTVLSGTYFSQLSDFLNILKLRFSSDFSFSDYRGQCYFCEKKKKQTRRSSMNQSMKAGAIPSLSYARRHYKCLLWFFIYYVMLEHCTQGKKPQCHSHPHNKKPAWEDYYIYYIHQTRNSRDFLSSRSKNRSTKQSWCQIHPSALLWSISHALLHPLQLNDWQHFDRSKACSWRV